MSKPVKDTPDNSSFEPARPRTFLGRQLMRIREEIVASGEPLLSWEEIARELSERRCEFEEQD